jgi:hypothetical protein
LLVNNQFSMVAITMKNLLLVAAAMLGTAPAITSAQRYYEDGSLAARGRQSVRDYIDEQIDLALREYLDFDEQINLALREFLDLDEGELVGRAGPPKPKPEPKPKPMPQPVPKPKPVPGGGSKPKPNPAKQTQARK